MRLPRAGLPAPSCEISKGWRTLNNTRGLNPITHPLHMSNRTTLVRHTFTRTDEKRMAAPSRRRASEGFFDKLPTFPLSGQLSLGPSHSGYRNTVSERNLLYEKTVIR